MALSQIHFKFKSQVDFDSVAFDGPVVTVGELKALIAERTSKMPPRIHDLVRLAGLCGVTLTEELEDLLLLLNRSYFESRYAPDVPRPATIVRAAKAQRAYQQTRMTARWLRSML